LLIGQFQKQVWSLWQNFGVINYTNVNGSQYQGAQGFNLGGRSIFWGSVIPQLASWQLAAWPAAVGDYLLNQGGYLAALKTFNADQNPDSAFQVSSRAYLDSLVPGWNAVDGPVAVQYLGPTNWSIPAGSCSSAALLLEDFLVQEPPQLNPPGRVPLTVSEPPSGPSATRTTRPGHRRPVLDLLAQGQRTLSGRRRGVVRRDHRVSESPCSPVSATQTGRSAGHRRSHDPLPALRRRAPNASTTDSAKLLLPEPAATVDQHAFDIIVGRGEVQPGRYIDNAPRPRQEHHNGYMLCEIVFQYYSPLLEENYVATVGSPHDPADPVSLFMTPATRPGSAQRGRPDRAERLRRLRRAAQYTGKTSRWPSDGRHRRVAMSGTLRMAGDGTGVVDADLKFLDYKNLCACDNRLPVS
jgi:hypothetical protein